jgi:hypothetical protein
LAEKFGVGLQEGAGEELREGFGVFVGEACGAPVIRELGDPGFGRLLREFARGGGQRGWSMGLGYVQEGAEMRED